MHCVIFIEKSFIEKSFHPKLNPLVPMVLKDLYYAQVCLYDASDKDVLLISNEFQWFKSSSTSFKQAGITLLFAILNHRYVFLLQVVVTLLLSSTTEDKALVELCDAPLVGIVSELNIDDDDNHLHNKISSLCNLSS